MPSVIKGKDQLDRKLTTIAKRSTRTRIKRKATTKGARIVTRATKDNTPRGTRPLQGRKRLRTTITSKVQTIKGTDVVVGIVGQNSRMARASRLGSEANKQRAVNIHLVDKATKAHTINARGGGVLAWGRGRRVRFAGRVSHPGTSGKNFVERSATQSLPAATTVMINEANVQMTAELSRG